MNSHEARRGKAKMKPLIRSLIEIMRMPTAKPSAIAGHLTAP